MHRHVKVFLDYHNLHGEVFICQFCQAGTTVDVHHVKPRSQGGKDIPSNLIALCRECHTAAHDEKISKETLFKIIEENE